MWSEIGPESKNKPATTSSDGEKSRRWRAGADTPSPRLSQVSDILFTGGDPMIMKTNMCDLRVLKCCGAFTSLDGLVAVSR